MVLLPLNNLIAIILLMAYTVAVIVIDRKIGIKIVKYYIAMDENVTDAMYVLTV